MKRGKVKPGKHQWKKSKTYQKLARKKRELERRKSAYAKSQNRRIVNEILRHGNQIKTENVSVKAWQKRYGKAISAKSPGFVQSELARKAVSAGGQFIKFSTSRTALSQTHLTGERIKKKLSERVHYDQTGVVMHRDLFAAYLSRYVNDQGVPHKAAICYISSTNSRGLAQRTRPWVSLPRKLLTLPMPKGARILYSTSEFARFRVSPTRAVTPTPERVTSGIATARNLDNLEQLLYHPLSRSQGAKPTPGRRTSRKSRYTENFTITLQKKREYT